MTEAVEESLMESLDDQAREMLEFIAASKRGVCGHVGRKANG